MSDSPILRLRDAAFGYDGRAVVGGVSLEVNPGEIIAVLGPNGSGKSTLMRGILGLNDHVSGQVELFGTPASSFKARTRIGGAGGLEDAHLLFEDRGEGVFLVSFALMCGARCADAETDALGEVLDARPHIPALTRGFVVRNDRTDQLDDIGAGERGLIDAR